MNQKMIITISEGHTFSEGGQPFISVDLDGENINYGGGSPCRTEEEVKVSVQHFKEWVIREGDTYVVRDLRKKATLLNFF